MRIVFCSALYYILVCRTLCIGSKYPNGYLKTSVFFVVPGTVAGLQPEAVGTDFLTVIWDEPTDTVFDTYRLAIVPDDNNEGTVNRAK